MRGAGWSRRAAGSVGSVGGRDGCALLSGLRRWQAGRGKVPKRDMTTQQRKAWGGGPALPFPSQPVPSATRLPARGPHAAPGTHSGSLRVGTDWFRPPAHTTSPPTPPPTHAAGPRKGRLLVACVQYTLMVGLCITYSVTAGQSLKGVASDECSGKDCQAVSRAGWAAGRWACSKQGAPAGRL